MSITGSLEDKLRLSPFVDGDRILDVGFNDGELTSELALRHPNKYVIGIDYDHGKVEASRAMPNYFTPVEATIESLNPLYGTFDTIIFSSVLHEIYSYGHGASSVLKTLCHAYERLNPGGRILVRDMMRPVHCNEDANGMYAKVNAVERHLVSRFEAVFGLITNIHQLNHYLLKASWPDYWHIELEEDYLATTSSSYLDYFGLLGMKCMYGSNYLLPYFKDLWAKKYDFRDYELAKLYSHGILVYEK